MDSSLNPFFNPRGIVIIGASTSPEKLGYGIARNLIQSGYPGAIHFVSQKQGELFGRPLYNDLTQIPDPVDLAVLVVPNIAMPDAKIEGAHIQRQIEGGQEVIVGVVRDPTFGPLVMFGSGGVEAEGLKDVAFALGPLSPLEAEEMMSKTWAGKKLDGFRNIPPADRAAVQDILIKLAWLAQEHTEIQEIEINPLRVLAKGAVTVDVRMKDV